MLEFTIMRGLKCTGNIDDYMYISSSKSALMSRYFSDNKGAITCSKLITRVQNRNFDKAEDALNLAILFFVHIFMFSQHKEAPISVAHFQIVEDGRYIHFPWGKPVSPDQSLKKRKTVMFDQEKQTVMDDDTFGCGHAVYHGSDLYCETHKNTTDKEKIGVSEIQHHHHVEIDVSPQSHQHKSVSSSSKQPEGTSKPSLDGDEIKNYINKCFAEKMAELATLISKIPAEVVKALKNEQNKQSQEDKIDEQQQSQEDGSNKQERQHKSDMQHEDYDKGSLNDMEVSRDEESNKQHLLEEQQLLDEVGGTITNSIQSVVDTLLFGLSTPSTTKSLDVGASNKMTERHWDLPDSQIPPGFPDAQVWELQASKSKAPAKRERKKSRILRSPYISKNGSSFKDAVDIDKEEKLKYVFDGYNINQDFPNELMIDYSQ
ncbi:hypothetical protein FXO38_11254 [Capsicum annuum]|nr:hypothetical protein FXO38_11254 [Capsicum annuum]